MEFFSISEFKPLTTQKGEADYRSPAVDACSVSWFVKAPYWSDPQWRARSWTTAAGCGSCCSRRSPRSSAGWTCAGGVGTPARPWTRHTASAQSQLQGTGQLWASLPLCQGPWHPPHLPMAFPSSLVEPVNILQQTQQLGFQLRAHRSPYSSALQEQLSTSGGTSQSSTPWALHPLNPCSLAALHAYFLSLSILLPAPSHSLPRPSYAGTLIWVTAC